MGLNNFQTILMPNNGHIVRSKGTYDIKVEENEADKFGAVIKNLNAYGFKQIREKSDDYVYDDGIYCVHARILKKGEKVDSISFLINIDSNKAIIKKFYDLLLNLDSPHTCKLYVPFSSKEISLADVNGVNIITSELEKQQKFRGTILEES